MGLRYPGFSCTRVCAVVAGLFAVVPAARIHPQSLAPTGMVATAAPTVAKSFYQEYQQIVQSCGNVCTMAFTAVPTGKVLIISHVSCFVTADGTAQILDHTLVSRYGWSRLIPMLIGTASRRRYFHSSNKVLEIVEAGDAPSIYIAWVSRTSMTLGCKIAGRLQPA